jgi:hypothetical protein
LHAEGIEAVVVANADDAAEIAPVAHNHCTLIKVHGDYLNPDLRNTIDELDHSTLRSTSSSTESSTSTASSCAAGLPPGTTLSATPSAAR